MKRIDATFHLMVYRFSISSLYKLTLQRFSSDGEEEIAKCINQYKGGPDALLANDAELRNLYGLETRYSDPEDQSITLDAASKRASRPKAVKEALDNERIKKLRDDLRMDVNKTIEQNLIVLEGKLKIELNRIEVSTGAAVKREGDRVIEALSTGPGHQILNKEMYTIWSYMGWRGSVKSLHFALALRDYYHGGISFIRPTTSDSKANDKEATIGADSINPRRNDSAPASIETTVLDTVPTPLDVHKPIVDPADQWALQYIRVDKLRAIMDAIDTDASGLITVKEINDFTQARPDDWSLLKWIAYWAIGWESAAVKYFDEIKRLFSQMLMAVPRVLSGNRRAVDSYIDSAWRHSMSITMSLAEAIETDGLDDCFIHYTAIIEQRLRQNLEKVHYIIADSATVPVLVDGPLERVSIIISLARFSVR